eukprot:CAMPEP_0119007678 /NCGR_PEP_ID=MMETSP1176-20130426/3173_1 /TAXON_ID=265551 /ORGANISM="Synedropsis recta cf, Strain CCMP1620" /LENGTH=388 /DNA_ID=CAMNT_0006959871 /DNA_START=324 /DNA_END=1490 /DNA_ORIENTATION=+
MPGCCEEDCCGVGTTWVSPNCIPNPSSLGFQSYAVDYARFGCHTRVCCEDDCCGAGTSYATSINYCVPPLTTAEPSSAVPQPSAAPRPTQSPSLQQPPAPVPPFECVPTTGPCGASEQELRSIISLAGPNDVISVCASVAPSISFCCIEPLVLAQPNMTLCCDSDDDCVLATTGGDTLVRVTGESSTISGFRFIAGGGRGRGSNLEIVANGTHLIEDSSFEDGQGSGPNVYVQTFGSLTVRRSSFVNGMSPTGGFDGNGLRIEDASTVVIEDSRFVDNEVAGLYLHWNSMLHDLQTMGQDITVYNSSFLNNGAEGIFATNLGKLPKLNIQLSTFEDNQNEAGSFLTAAGDYGEHLRLSGNGGFGNGNSRGCADFFFWNECIPLDEEIP